MGDKKTVISLRSYLYRLIALSSTAILVVSVGLLVLLSAEQAPHRHALSVLIGATLFVAVIWAAGAYANRLVRPLRKLAERVEEVRWLNLTQDFKVATDVREVQQLSQALESMQAGLQSFARFVPRDMVRQILGQGKEAVLGGEKRMASILFADIQGYSRVAEQLDPEQTILMLNQYFQAMQSCVAMYGGTVIEHMGDSVLAVFNAPNVLQGHEANATLAALAMTESLQELNKGWEQGVFAEAWQQYGEGELKMRIGLHRGLVVAGNIGGAEYMKYGVIGDAVNVAARLEALNKEYATSVMLSQQVYAELDANLAALFTSRGSVSLKGRKQRQAIYTLKLID